MKTMQETYKGIGFCLLIAIPAFLLGKQFEVIGGPVFAILIGMCLALLVKRAGRFRRESNLHLRRFCNMQSFCWDLA